MTEYLGPLMTDSTEIQSEVTKRKKKVIEKTIRAKNLELLKQKLEIAEKEGWRLLRENVASYRLALEKPFDEQLEDEVWCFLAKMQFKEMSHGRNFKILTDPGTEPRQIDVFAKDDESVIYVECTHSETPSVKRMGPLIEKIESIKPKVSKSIKKHYGKDKKLKEGWVIATRNVIWSKPDLERARAAKIIVFRDIQIDYYNKITQLYRLGAKYQLLSHVFAKEKIPGLELVVPATRGKMGGVDFYNFLINPLELIKISHVSHKASRDVQDVATYQRLLKPKRLKALAKYIDEGGQFPTNIVLNIRSGRRGLKFDKIEKVGDSAFGRLHLPSQYAVAMVIDGQHRLYGYTYSERVLKKDHSHATIPVLAYENLPPTQEAKLFVDINCEQVRVDRNLVKEIHSELYRDSEDANLLLDSLRANVVMNLDSDESSPIYDRIKLSTKEEGNYLRCLTLNSFADGLKDNKLLGDEKDSKFVAGPLSDSSPPDSDKTVEKSTEVIKGYLKVFATKAVYHWDLGNIKKEKESLIGFLATNEGIRALLVVLKDILEHIRRTTGVETYYLDSSELLPKIEVLAEPIAEIFKHADFVSIDQFRSRGGGKKGVNLNAKFMETFIHTQFEEFCPEGLEDFIERMDFEGTKEAKILIGEIVRKIHDFVIWRLKELYPGRTATGKPKWWFQGVPPNVREECVAKSDRGGGEKEPEQYLDIVDYQSIALKNWRGCFEEPFSFTKEGGKDKKTAWLNELNTIRNITHHENKWPADVDQVARVREIHKEVMERFVMEEELV